VCVLTDFSVQPNTGKYTLARFFVETPSTSRRKIKRQADEHHTAKEENDELF